MKCSKCFKSGEFPRLICNCTICRDCFYDFCCPKCRRDFIDFDYGIFPAEVFKVEEGIIFNRRGSIYFSSLALSSVKIFGVKYDETNTLIKKDILKNLNFRYLCARDFRTGYLSQLIIDLNDFRVFRINIDFTIQYISDIKSYFDDFPELPIIRRQMNFR